MANNGISGRAIIVTTGASPTTFVGVQNWTVEDSVQELDATTAADGGYSHPQAGIQGATISFTAIIDVTGGSITGMQAGTVLTSLACWSHQNSANPIYVFPSALVTKSTPKGEINGRFTFDVTARSIGSYTNNQPN